MILAKRLRVPTDQRLFAVQAAFERGVPLETVHDLTRIDRWFLSKMSRIARLRAAMEGMSDVGDLDLRALRKVKQAGFSDDQVAHYTKCLPDRARRHRLSLNLRPVVKQIDTLGAEFPACTNYLYMTYHGTQSDVEPEDRGVMVLGCGAYCIGSSVEFDWSAVSCVRQCRASGYRAVVVNYNPETGSTVLRACHATRVRQRPGWNLNLNLVTIAASWPPKTKPLDPVRWTRVASMA